MKEMIVFQTCSAAILYLFLFTPSWIRAWRGLEPIQNRPFYFVGLIFSALFYYGTPIWVWIYGWKNTVIMITACFVITFIIVQSINIAFPIKDKFVAGLYIQIIARVLVGFWLAKNHIRLAKSASTANR